MVVARSFSEGMGGGSVTLMYGTVAIVTVVGLVFVVELNPC